MSAAATTADGVRRVAAMYAMSAPTPSRYLHRRMPTPHWASHLRAPSDPAVAMNALDERCDDDDDANVSGTPAAVASAHLCAHRTRASPKMN